MRFTKLGDMFTWYHTKAVNIPPKEVNMNNGKIMKDLEEIAKLNYDEEGRLELENEIEEWENWIRKWR